MRRTLIPLLLLLAAAGPCFAGSTAILRDSIFGATGIKADGVTSDDVAVAAAVAKCSVSGGTLVLPAGKILLTGAATITLANCALVGAKVPPGNAGSVPSFGTTFLLTSTSVQPFIIKQNWSITGVGFFWPNQTTGTTAYPPLFIDDGADGAGFFFLDNVTVANAYDIFTQTANGWGNFMIENSTLYPLHNGFTLKSIGDAVHFTGLHVAPGAWFQMCPSLVVCQTAVNAAMMVNKLIDVQSGTGVELQIVGADIFGLRYGLFIENGGNWNNGHIDAKFDDVGTIIDASTGTASYPAQNYIAGHGTTCSIPQFGSTAIGNWPCFNMGNNSFLDLSHFEFGSRGDGVDTAGSTIILRDSIVGIGAALDGGDYYVVKVTGGQPEIILQNNRLNGQPSDTHSHGLIDVVGGSVSGPANKLVIQDNTFLNFNDDVDIATSPTTLISGNVSANTTGSVSVIFQDMTNGIFWDNNFWDEPPLTTVSACGSGATINGTIAGFVRVGTTNPTTSCTLTFPFIPRGGSGGNCLFGGPENEILTGPSGNVWTLTFSSDVHGQAVFFQCKATQ